MASYKEENHFCFSHTEMLHLWKPQKKSFVPSLLIPDVCFIYWLAGFSAVFFVFVSFSTQQYKFLFKNNTIAEGLFWNIYIPDMLLTFLCL